MASPLLSRTKLAFPAGERLGSARGRHDAEVQAQPDLTQGQALSCANQAAIARVHAGRDRDEAAGDRAADDRATAERDRQVAALDTR